MPLRSRIFILFALVLAMAVYGLFSWMRSDMMPRYLEAQEDLLVDMAWVLASDIEVASTKDNAAGGLNLSNLSTVFQQVQRQHFGAQIYDLHKTHVSLRVYVTNAQGKVLFDSDHGRDLGQDYSGWRDVELTLNGQYGARTTHADPMFAQGSTMYVAAPIILNGDIAGVVSVGKPTRNAQRFLHSAVSRFALAAVMIAVLALGLLLILYTWVSRPLLLLHQYAEDLLAGRRVAPPRLGHSEIARVGQSIAQLRQALDGKAYIEQYVQALTHELKSPTAAIAGAAELLTEAMPEADRQRFLANITGEAARLRALIERMLELAEIENREALDATQKLAPEQLLDDALNSVAAALQRKQLQVQRDVPANLQLSGDALLLHRALVNLLGNAIDFSPMGGVIQVQVQVEGQYLTFTIEDQGSGIPAYALERVFERFYTLPRADGSKGTGLGLSFVQQIAQLHGGAIELSSLPQGGTQARLRLPLG